MMKKLWNKFKANIGVSEQYCVCCGSDKIVPHGYHIVSCNDCGEEVYYEDGNLAMDGKSHLYKGVVH